MRWRGEKGKKKREEENRKERRKEREERRDEQEKGVAGPMTSSLSPGSSQALEGPKTESCLLDSTRADSSSSPSCESLCRHTHSPPLSLLI